MRRTAGVLGVAGLLITAGSLTAVPAGSASAAAGFWRTIGSSGAEAWGFYFGSNGRLAVNFDLRDTARDGRSAAVRFTFTKKGKRNDVRLVALKGDKVQDAWKSVTTPNDQHMYAQPCVGTWKRSVFTARTCGPWRQYF